MAAFMTDYYYYDSSSTVPLFYVDKTGNVWLWCPIVQENPGDNRLLPPIEIWVVPPAAVILIGLLILIFYCCCVRKRSPRQSEPLSTVSVERSTVQSVPCQCCIPIPATNSEAKPSQKQLSRNAALTRPGPSSPHPPPPPPEPVVKVQPVKTETVTVKQTKPEERKPDNETKKEPLLIKEPPKDVTCNVGDEAVYECTVSVQDMDVEWTLNGHVVEKSDQQYEISKRGDRRTFKIKKVAKQDFGSIVARYKEQKCQAKLVDKLANLKLLKPLQDVKVKEGAEATLRCEFSIPDSEAEWLKGDTVLHPGKDDRIKPGVSGKVYTLKISNSRESDTAQYEIRLGDVKSFAKVEVEVPVKIIRGLAPVTVKNGDQAVLEAEINKPNMNPTWTKNGKAFTPDGVKAKSIADGKVYRLVFGSAVSSDAGNYALKFVDVTSSAPLQVEEEPVVFVQTLGHQTLKSYPEKVAFACELNKPNVKVAWTKNGQPIDTSRGQIQIDGSVHRLILPKAEPLDEGEYECAVAKDNKTTGKLLFRIPPHLQIDKYLNKVLEIKTSEKIECEIPYTGYPKPKFSATFTNGAKLPDVSRMKLVETGGKEAKVALTITNAVPSDSGTYTVIAENEGGRATGQLQLTVKEPEKKPEPVQKKAEPPAAPPIQKKPEVIVEKKVEPQKKPAPVPAPPAPVQKKSEPVQRKPQPPEKKVVIEPVKPQPPPKQQEKPKEPPGSPIEALDAHRSLVEARKQRLLQKRMRSPSGDKLLEDKPEFQVYFGTKPSKDRHGNRGEPTGKITDMWNGTIMQYPGSPQPLIDVGPQTLMMAATAVPPISSPVPVTPRNEPRMVPMTDLTGLEWLANRGVDRSPSPARSPRLLLPPGGGEVPDDQRQVRRASPSTPGDIDTTNLVWHPELKCFVQRDDHNSYAERTNRALVVPAPPPDNQRRLIKIQPSQSPEQPRDFVFTSNEKPSARLRITQLRRNKAESEGLRRSLELPHQQNETPGDFRTSDFYDPRLPANTTRAVRLSRLAQQQQEATLSQQSQPGVAIIVDAPSSAAGDNRSISPAFAVLHDQTFPLSPSIAVEQEKRRRNFENAVFLNYDGTPNYHPDNRIQSQEQQQNQQQQADSSSNPRQVFENQQQMQDRGIYPWTGPSPRSSLQAPWAQYK